MARLGVEVDEVSIDGGAGPSGHFLCQVRRLPLLGRIGLVSRGPVWTGTPDAARLVRAVSALGHPVVLNAEGMDRAALAAAGFFQIMTGATIAQLDLSGDASARRLRMHQKWRNRLNRAAAGPLRVSRERMPLKPDHWLFKAELAQRRARGYRALPHTFVLAFAETNPGQAQLFTAHLAGEPVAGMLILRHGPTATYHMGHTTEAGRAEHAHNLLLAHAADWLAEHGTDILELGTLDTVNAPGIARFKLGSGATPHVLGGTWLHARHLAPLARLFG